MSEPNTNNLLPEIDLNKPYRTNSQFILREIAGESVLIPIGANNPMGGQTLLLNDTCCFLWKQFQSPTTVQTAIENAKQVYSDIDNELEQQIKEFVTILIGTGFLEET